MPSEYESSVLAFAVSPGFEADGTCFAATQGGQGGQGGLLRTVDHGTTWTSAFPNAPELRQVPATAVAVSPDFARDRVVLAAIPGGIGRSTDGGESWRFVRLPLPAPLVSAIAFSPDFVTDRLVLAGTMQDGVYRSEDGGESWVAWNAGLYDMSVLAVAISPEFGQDQLLFAGTGSGVYRSADRGRSWSPSDILPSLPGVLSLDAVPARGDGFDLLAGTEANGLWRSPDGGRTWSSRADMLEGAVHAIARCPAHAERGGMLILGDEKLAASRDGGRVWQVVDDLPASAGEITAIALLPASGGKQEGIVGTVDGRIHRVALPW